MRTALVREQSEAARDAMRRWARPCDAYSHERARGLLARSLLRGLLVEMTGAEPSCWMFETEPSGQPVARRGGGDSGPSIAISHSGGWVACAASARGRVGIDIERHRPGRDIAGIAGLAFGGGERRDVERGGAAAFYRIWTQREALAKARGRGLAEAADGVDRAAGFPGDGAEWRRIGGETWWLAQATPVEGLSLAVAFTPAAGVHPARNPAAASRAGFCPSRDCVDRSTPPPAVSRPKPPARPAP